MLAVILNWVHHRLSILHIRLLALAQKVTKNADSFSISGHIIRAFFLDFREVLSELLQNLAGRLFRDLFEAFGYFTAFVGEDLEFAWLDDKVVLWTFLAEAFEELASLFDKAFIFIADELGVRDTRDVAARPALV